MSRKTFKEPDARVQTQLTPEQVQFFATNGYLVIRNVLCEDVRFRQLSFGVISYNSCYRRDPQYVFASNDVVEVKWNAHVRCLIPGIREFEKCYQKTYR